MANKKNNGVEKQDMSAAFDLLNKVKENGTITLNDLMAELAKTGVKDIDFEDFCFNLETSSLDKVDKTDFEENVDEILQGDLLKASEEEDFTIDKDIQLLDCILAGSFEADDIEKLLALMDIDTIREYIKTKISILPLGLRDYTYLLMDLRNH